MKHFPKNHLLTHALYGCFKFLKWSFQRVSPGCFATLFSPSIQLFFSAPFVMSCSNAYLHRLRHFECFFCQYTVWRVSIFFWTSHCEKSQKRQGKVLFNCIHSRHTMFVMSGIKFPWVTFFAHSVEWSCPGRSVLVLTPPRKTGPPVQSVE